VRVASLPIQNVLRTETTGESRGFMKALVDAQRDHIRGSTMFGAEAGEVASTVQIAMSAGLPYASLRDAVLAHPTMAEGLNVLFRQDLRPTQNVQPVESRAEQPGA
jgi:pyruvate/2-oxoglutarate dehydrogenase complex dihydrolipoamide dehydrogenase (E3) component